MHIERKLHNYNVVQWKGTTVAKMTTLLRFILLLTSLLVKPHRLRDEVKVLLTFPRSRVYFGLLSFGHTIKVVLESRLLFLSSEVGEGRLCENTDSFKDNAEYKLVLSQGKEMAPVYYHEIFHYLLLQDQILQL